MQPNPRELRMVPAASVDLVATTDEPRRGRGAGAPMPITREQFRAILAEARSIDHRLLIETLWQSGGRVSEVIRLRPCDVAEDDAALHLPNEKQRQREKRQKLVFISRDLAAELLAFARGARIHSTMPFFRSRSSGKLPMHRAQAWRVVTTCARRAGVLVPGKLGELVPASPLNFRHGSAVHQIREGVPLTEVQRQLGHSRIESTLVYLRLTDPERRSIADRVEW